MRQVEMDKKWVGDISPRLRDSCAACELRRTDNLSRVWQCWHLYKGSGRFCTIPWLPAERSVLLIEGQYSHRCVRIKSNWIPANTALLAPQKGLIIFRLFRLMDELPKAAMHIHGRISHNTTKITTKNTTLPSDRWYC